MSRNKMSSCFPLNIAHASGLLLPCPVCKRIYLLSSRQYSTVPCLAFAAYVTAKFGSFASVQFTQRHFIIYYNIVYFFWSRDLCSEAYRKCWRIALVRYETISFSKRLCSWSYSIRDTRNFKPSLQHTHIYKLLKIYLALYAYQNVAVICCVVIT